MRRLIARICLGISIVGTLGIAALFALLGFMIATGGLYANGRLSGTTFLLGFYGIVALLIGLLPFGFGLLWVKVEWRQTRPPWGLKILTGIVIAGCALLGTLWMITGPSVVEARLAAALSVPFFAFVVFLKFRNMSEDR